MTSKNNATKPTRKVDWSLVKREYEIGDLSIRAIARRFGTSDMSVRRKIKRFGWKREQAQRPAHYR